MWQGRKKIQKSQWLNIINIYFSLRLDWDVAEQRFSSLSSHHGQHEKQELPSCCWRKEVGEESTLVLNCSSLEGKWLSGKESTCQCRRGGDLCSIPGSGRSLGGGNSYPLRDSCLENSMDRGAWQATVHWDTTEQLTLSLQSSATHRPIKLDKGDILLIKMLINSFSVNKNAALQTLFFFQWSAIFILGSEISESMILAFWTQRMFPRVHLYVQGNVSIPFSCLLSALLI